jgi:hypothetical protein
MVVMMRIMVVLLRGGDGDIVGVTMFQHELRPLHRQRPLPRGLREGGPA